LEYAASVKVTLAGASIVVKAEETRIRATLHRVWNERVPVVVLPVEILAAIFKEACKQPSNIAAMQRSQLRDIRECRNAINATCYRWRQVALVTSSLWNDILSVHTTMSGDVRIPHKQLIPIELERSNRRALAIHAIVCGGNEGCDDLFCTLCSLAPLSSTLDLVVEAWPLQFHLLNGGISLSNLRRLWLNLRHPDIECDSERIDLTQATSLCFVSLEFSMEGMGISRI
jgi:hypothetical protein